METYKKNIRTRTIFLFIAVLISGFFAVYDVFFVSESVKDNFIFGFQSGVVTALGVLCAAAAGRYSKILKDEKRLRQEYNRENDERLRAIRAKAGIPILPVLSVIIIIAGIAAGYFRPILFTSFVGIGMFQLLVCAAVKFIYIKKM